MDYPRQVSLRISEDQYQHCISMNGVTKHIRRLLEIDMATGTTEIEKLVIEYMKKYAPDKSV